MVLMYVEYGQKCPQSKDIKKTSQKICENCPNMKGVYGTFSTCYLKVEKN